MSWTRTILLALGDRRPLARLAAQHSVKPAFDQPEWLVEKHGERGARTWRKLHLAVDPSTGEILASELTSNEEGDASQVDPLLEQVPGSIASVTADGDAAELAPANLRGRFTSGYQIAVTLGIFLAYLISGWLSDSGDWSIMREPPQSRPSPCSPLHRRRRSRRAG